MERDNKYIGNTDNKPTDKAIKMYKLGQQDGQKAKILADKNKLTPAKVRKIIESYASHGDIHQLSIKYDLSAANIKKLLSSLNIESIEQGRKFLEKFTNDNSVLEEQVIQKLIFDEEKAAANKRLDTHTKELEQQDISKINRSEFLAKIQEKSKQEKIRETKSKVNSALVDAGDFKIPQARENEFRQIVINGLAAAQRRFGGTKKQIRAEASRLLPNIDISLIP